MGLLQKRLVTAALALCVAATALLTTQAAAANAKTAGKKKHAAGEDIFDNKHVLPIRIDISDSELKALARDNRHFVRATVHEGTNQWKDVGVHLKGAAGSFRGVEDKPALTLSFGKFTPDQKFHGLRKIHLNNSVQDGSYMTENICGELFRKAGVPAARVSYATVEINGRKKGFYVLKEGFSKEMLALSFRNTHGNLYDGGFLREITDQLERDSGAQEDVDDWSDLKALAKAAQEPDATKRFSALTNVLDMDRFISFMVLETMTWDWDGYVMNRNNYRVYHNLDTGKMVFFPHGMDQMFWQPDGPIIGNMQGLVAQAVIKTPEGSQRYYDRFGEVFTNVFQLAPLTNRVAELATLIRSALTNLNGPNAGRDYDGQANRIRDLIVGRHASLEKQLAVPRPKPIKFENGLAHITGWAIPQTIVEQGNATRDKIAVDSRQTLHIRAQGPTSASWRAEVLLDSGHYRFEAEAKTAQVVAVRDSIKGEGAGVRISGSQSPRPNKLSGDAPWQKITYEFDAVANLPVILVCELRASKGDAWFDADSLKLVKLK